MCMPLSSTAPHFQLPLKLPSLLESLVNREVRDKKVYAIDRKSLSKSKSDAYLKIDFDHDFDSDTDFKWP